MKILIFAHSSSGGGADNALRHFVDLMRLRHEVHVVLPVIESHEGIYYRDLGLRCFELKFQFALPNVPLSLLFLLSVNCSEIIEELGREEYDLVVSNTMATLHGNRIAQLLRIPLITYVHEFLEDPDLLPIGLNKSGYLNLISQSSVGLLCCSKMALSQFEALSGPQPSRALLLPFDFQQPTVPRPELLKQRVLQVIGIVSHRKNVVFAANVAKALNVLGQPVRLEFIGHNGPASAKLEHMLVKRDIDSKVLANQENPYERNLGLQVVTLVCSRSEAFGLTLAESLRLGVPAVASRCGGPEEVLPPDLLFDVDDVDGCVRILLSIWNDYEEASAQSIRTYERLQQEVAETQPVDALFEFIEASAAKPPAEGAAIPELLQMLVPLMDAPLELDVLVQSIQKVAAEDGLNQTVEDIWEVIERERDQPGRAVTADILEFGAVPFGMSASVEKLNRQGLGLAIERAATCHGPERLLMASFIACSLWQATQDSEKPLTILALSDGVGSDSIRLAQAGFAVHYMDLEQSSMAKVAARNFKAYADTVADGTMNQVPLIVSQVKQEYDAVVCLEGIQRVPDPESFIAFIADALKPDGLVYISERFNGIEDRCPTHLASNERYAGQLPFLMHPRFRLVDFNRKPFAKPYVFRKRAPQDRPSLLELLGHREVMTELVQQQLDLGGI